MFTTKKRHSTRPRADRKPLEATTRRTAPFSTHVSKVQLASKLPPGRGWGCALVEALVPVEDLHRRLRVRVVRRLEPEKSTREGKVNFPWERIATWLQLGRLKCERGQMSIDIFVVKCSISDCSPRKKVIPLSAASEGLATQFERGLPNHRSKDTLRYRYSHVGFMLAVWQAHSGRPTKLVSPNSQRQSLHPWLGNNLRRDGGGVGAQQVLLRLRHRPRVAVPECGFRV